jgi:tRNA 2-selenouridine synthase
MKEMGEPVVDLEGLANHRGSAFGGIGLPAQPTTEQFENNLFSEVVQINNSYIWVEDESSQIGRLFIPEAFFKQMSASPILFIEVPNDYRIDVLVSEYAKLDPELLEVAINKLKRRLGDLASRQAVESLKEGDFATTAKILLSYYDKTYRYGLDMKNPKNVHRLDLTKLLREDYAKAIISQKNFLLRKNDTTIQ